MLSRRHPAIWPDRTVSSGSDSSHRCDRLPVVVDSHSRSYSECLGPISRTGSGRSNRTLYRRPVTVRTDERTGDDSNVEVADRFTVRSGGSEVRMPYAIHTFTEVGDGAIVGLDPADANPKDSDFTVGDRSENLVRVSGDCALEWVADAADFPVDDAVHEEISVHDGRLVTETDVERYAEFDLDSGAFRDSWPLDEFVIGDRRHEFERPVESVESLDGAWLLQTARRLHWFDRTGNRLAEWSMEDLRKQDQYGDLTPKSYRVEDAPRRPGGRAVPTQDHPVRLRRDGDATVEPTAQPRLGVPPRRRRPRRLYVPAAEHVRDCRGRRRHRSLRPRRGWSRERSRTVPRHLTPTSVGRSRVGAYPEVTGRRRSVVLPRPSHGRAVSRMSGG